MKKLKSPDSLTDKGKTVNDLAGTAAKNNFPRNIILTSG